MQQLTYAGQMKQRHPKCSDSPMIKPTTYQPSMGYTHRTHKSKSCTVTDVAIDTASKKSVPHLEPNVKNVAKETTLPQYVPQRQLNCNHYSTTVSKKRHLTMMTY